MTDCCGSQFILRLLVGDQSEIQSGTNDQRKFCFLNEQILIFETYIVEKHIINTRPKQKHSDVKLSQLL